MQSMNHEKGKSSAGWYIESTHSAALCFSEYQVGADHLTIPVSYTR